MSGDPDFMGDSICDDHNNMPECEFDGGDCCLDVSVVSCQFCSECLCHETGEWICGTLVFLEIGKIRDFCNQKSSVSLWEDLLSKLETGNAMMRII